MQGPGSSANQTRGPVDLAFIEGGVYTVDAARRWADAVAVQDGRIVAVGTDAAIRELIGPRTQVVSLRGRMLLPGFQDCHVHAPAGGIERLQLDLSERNSYEQYVDEIQRYAATHPDAAWITGGGWVATAFANGIPTAGLLDAIVPDRPVLLSDRNHHTAWVNTRALEAAGLRSDTPDPPDGRIVRDDNAHPIGWLLEGAANLVAQVAPPISDELRREGLLLAQQYLHSLGVTAWQDAMVGGSIGAAASFEHYLDASERADLTARVVGALWYERGVGPEQLSYLSEQRARADAEKSLGRFRATTVKLMVDGSLEAREAAMFDSYLDEHGHPTDNVGMELFDPDELRAAVVALDAQGFQAHIHVLGDRACASALDALEAAVRTNGRSDNRHHLAHFHVVRPSDVPRLRPLGVAATVQPLWAAHGPPMDELTIPCLGEPRASWQYPFASLARTGAVMAFGSDWPISSPNPLWGIHVAVNRALPRGHPDAEGAAARGAFIPTERLDLPAAIAAYTMGSAFVNHLDRETGSIEVGKLADLAVIDRNLFDGPADEIGDAEVLLTVVGGEPVYASPREL